MFNPYESERSIDGAIHFCAVVIWQTRETRMPDIGIIIRNEETCVVSIGKEPSLENNIVIKAEVAAHGTTPRSALGKRY